MALNITDKINKKNKFKTYVMHMKTFQSQFRLTHAHCQKKFSYWYTYCSWQDNLQELQHVCQHRSLNTSEPAINWLKFLAPQLSNVLQDMGVVKEILNALQYTLTYNYKTSLCDARSSVYGKQVSFWHHRSHLWGS